MLNVNSLEEKNKKKIEFIIQILRFSQLILRVLRESGVSQIWLILILSKILFPIRRWVIILIISSLVSILVFEKKKKYVIVSKLEYVFYLFFLI